MQVKAQSDVKKKTKPNKNHKKHKTNKKKTKIRRKNTQYLMFVTIIVNDICTVNEKFLQV